MVKLPHNKYQIGQCLINCQDLTISKDKKTVQLPAKVFEFLKLLIKNYGQTVTKEQVIEQIWMNNIEVGKRGAGNAIWHLRKSFTELDVEPSDIFRTITKVGYVLLLEPSPIFSEAFKTNIETVEVKTINDKKRTKTRFVIGIISLLIAMAYIYSEKFLTENKSSKKYTTEIERITNFEGVEELPSISKDGQYMAFQWLQQGKSSQIFIQDLVNKDSPLRQLSISSAKELSPAWSPDSKKIAYFRMKDNKCSLHIREFITNLDKVIGNDCTTSGYLRSLDWSTDGKTIAYSRQLSDRVAIFVYSIDNESVEQYSFPKSGEKDLLMSWSQDNNRLAFVRSAELSAQLLITDNSQQENIIIDNEKMILGLAWDNKNDDIYFNVMRDADFSIEKYDVNKNSVEEFHRDTGIYSLGINEASSELFYSRHIVQEHIVIRSLTDGKVIQQVVSSSRDLYGQFVANTGSILFLSNRSGIWEVWLKHNNTSTQITNNQGQVTIPAVSPIDNSFAIAMKEESDDHFSLYIGQLTSGKLTKVLDLNGNIRNPSYSMDGKEILFSSNIGKAWGIYRYNIKTQKLIKLVEDNGKYAIENSDGGIYYSKDNESGIFYLSQNGKTRKTITTELSNNDWGSFFIQNNNLYFLKRNKDNDILMSIDNEGEEKVVLTLPRLSIRNEKGFSPALDGTVIISMQGLNDADIYSVKISEKLK